MSEKHTMVVEAICNGTVLDHIPAGRGLAILRHFRLDHAEHRITVGFNLTSAQEPAKKDLIKIENVHFSDSEAAWLALFAPEITVNVIANFNVVKKFTPALPEIVSGLFPCPNSNCASHSEPVNSRFIISHIAGRKKLTCCFCEKSYPLDWIIEANH